MTNKPIYVLFTIDDRGLPDILLQESINRVRLEKQGIILLNRFEIVTGILPIQNIKAQLIICKDRALLGCSELPECLRKHKTVKHHIKRVCDLIESMCEGWVEECDDALDKETLILLGYARNNYRAYDLLREAHQIAGEIYNRNRGLMP